MCARINYIEKWTVGFDKLKEQVKSFTLEEVEKWTWVPIWICQDANGQHYVAIDDFLCFMQGR
jgi:hypothetical protein